MATTCVRGSTRISITSEDRAENVRRVAEVAKLMSDAGLVVFVALVSPYRADREAAAALFDEGDFLEVFVDTPVEVCRARPEGPVCEGSGGNLPNMTGMGQSYEAPENADVVLDGAGDLDTQVDTLARPSSASRRSGIPPSHVRSQPNFDPKQVASLDVDAVEAMVADARVLSLQPTIWMP